MAQTSGDSMQEACDSSCSEHLISAVSSYAQSECDPSARTTYAWEHATGSLSRPSWLHQYIVPLFWRAKRVLVLRCPPTIAEQMSSTT
eukprot:6188014-Pleurochrysis_carterae.AAC.1